MTIALIDANVLYPATLRDLFLWLAAGGVYRPRWSEEIHDEWMRNVLTNRPDLSRAQLERTRRLMDQVDPNSLVTGYAVRIPGLTLPDADDRHVLAAAIQANVTTIVTFNLSDFPARTLALTASRRNPRTRSCAAFSTLRLKSLSLPHPVTALPSSACKKRGGVLRRLAAEPIAAIGNPLRSAQKRAIRTSPCAWAKRPKFALRWRLW